jgi:GTP pyrophosphokinase
VLVNGVDEVFVRYGKCCTPIPGEPIVGFLTHGNGVTIHTTGCKSLIGLDSERFIEVSWDTGTAEELVYEVCLKVKIRPAKGGLSKIVAALSDAVIDIAEAHTSDARNGRLLFKVTVKNFAQYLEAVRTLTDMGGLVERVERAYPGEFGEKEEEAVD